LEGLPENYLELDEFANYKLLIDIINQDQFTFDIVYTDDMNVIPRFINGRMIMAEGRAITPADDGLNVCVISRSFARQLGLQIGDTLTFSLGDVLFEQHAGLGAVAVTRSRYAPPVARVELEIIGIYNDTDTVDNRRFMAHHSYSFATVFVPLSLLPQTADTANTPVKPGAFSIVIENARDIPAFLRESAPRIEQMGLMLHFYDGGWMNIEREFALTQRISVIAIIALLVTAAAVIALVVFLFIMQKKTDFAIMRATGCSKIRASGALFLPLLVITVLAVGIGSTAGWINSAAGIESVLAEGVLAEFEGLDVSIPLNAAFGTIFGLIILTSITACFGLWRVSMYPPLALIQGGIKKKIKRKKMVIEDAPNLILSVQNMSAVPGIPGERGNTAAKQVFAYIFRNIKASKFKSALSLAVAAVILIAAVQFALVRQAAKDLFETMPVPITLSGQIIINRAYEQFIRSGLVEPDPFLISTNFPSFWVGNAANGWYEPYAADEVYHAGRDVVPIFTNDFHKYMGIPIEIEHYGGEVPFPRRWQELVMISETQGGWVWHFEYGHVYMTGCLMDTLGVNVGDRVNMLWQDNGYEIVVQGSLFVAGRINFETESPIYRLFFTPDSQWLWSVNSYTRVEFILADNTRAKELRDLAESLSWQGFSYLFNTEELDRISNNIALYDMFLPFVIAALALVGGLLPGLIIMQSSKEAALLRALGTTKMRTRMKLTGQQLVLCFAGLAAGLLFLWISNGAERLGGVGRLFIICVGLNALCFTVAAILCAFAVTRKKVLELLQTKE
jgi:ABC-type lipoprotein release transport system permease subunit